MSETAHPVFAPIYSYCLADEGLSIPRHRGIVGDVWVYDGYGEQQGGASGGYCDDGVGTTNKGWLRVSMDGRMSSVRPQRQRRVLALRTQH